MKHSLAKLVSILLFVLTINKLEAQTIKKPKSSSQINDPIKDFLNPPESAKPGVLWMWMGANLSKEGITKDLEALKKEGFNRTTMFSLADITTPWACDIGKSPTPDIISWTEPWWKLVRHAAEESKRLGMDFGTFNGPSYESSGGVWITPELSMQEICWSKQSLVKSGKQVITLAKPEVNPRANQYFPVYNPNTGLVEYPVTEARKTYYNDIAVLAMPAKGIIDKTSIIDLSNKMQANGTLDWDVPDGEWTIYRFGHTTRGTLIQPAQWKATGFECDKMSQKAVDFHLDHVIGEIQKHLGDLIGTGFTHVHFDSYEAGNPTWTPKMKEEFLARRGYDLTPYLVTFAGRVMDSKDSTKFRNDFEATIKDLYRDVYFTTISKKLKAANLTFLCEPYGGPWRQDEVMPLVHNVMTEFWTHKGKYSPYELEPTVEALRKSGQNLIEAEAFTGDAPDSKWDETPAWIKPIGDAAFCAGVNRMILHRFVQQPWDDKYKPGATMGRWGTHFDRTQTWWKTGAKPMVTYWQRCQALLQWGKIAQFDADDFTLRNVEGDITVKQIHRHQDNMDVYFVANISREKGAAVCAFKVSGMLPELWNPVTGEMKTLSEYEYQNGKILLSLKFDEAQSFFVVFRNKLTNAVVSKKKNFPTKQELTTITTPWKVQFDPTWGGPVKAVTFTSLEDWTKRPESGIKYFSGTAVYQNTFDMSALKLANKRSGMYLDLGTVKHVARVILNNKDLGVVWTAPYQVKIPAGLLKNKANKLVIEVTNVWANRLIGDEQEPADMEWLPGHLEGGSYLKEFPDWFLKNQVRPSKGRFCFTTWNYFNKDSPLVSSGLLGSVKVLKE